MRRCTAADARRFSSGLWYAFGLIGAFLGYIVLGVIAILTNACGSLSRELWAILALLTSPALAVAVCRLIPADGMTGPVPILDENDRVSFRATDERGDEAAAHANTVAAIAAVVERIMQGAEATEDGRGSIESAKLFGEAPSSS